MENRLGLMDLGIKEIGSLTKRVVTASCTTQTTMSTRASGRTTRPMEGESTRMLTGLSIMESGRMISNMDLERKAGLMGHFMKDSILKAKRMEKENLYLPMEVSTKVNSK